MLPAPSPFTLYVVDRCIIDLLLCFGSLLKIGQQLFRA